MTDEPRTDELTTTAAVTGPPGGTTWRNWGRTESVAPQRIATPTDVAQVQGMVRDARAAGTTVKAVGSGHSFSAIAVAPGVLLEMSGLRGLVSVDTERERVTLGGGTKLHEIPALLQPYGLAMTNLGDIDQQTITGATSTGTHGTGLAFGGLSTQVVGLTIVDGRGEIVTVTDDDPTLLQAAALGLGALGIVVEITLQCVPSFAIRADERPDEIDTAVSGFADAVAAHDHHEFYWFPHTDIALTKTNRRLPATTPRSGPSAVRRFIDDELLSNGVFRMTCAAAAAVPSITPRINDIAARALSARTYVGSSTDAFVSPRRVRFREMEYAIALDQVPDAVAEIRTLIERRDFRVSFPIEVRAAAGDDLMMSTASGRDSGYIAVHRYFRDRDREYFTAVEEIMTRRGGRPHWGKMHTRDAEYLRSVYPRFDEFLAVRDEFDPDRVFSNPYLERTLGR